MDALEPVVRTISSRSAEETFRLGHALGQVLHPNDFVGLDGRLGAGKTQFARGVAAGAEVPLEDVSSPTYSIVQTYQGRVTLHHADLYRLTSEADLFGTGYFDLLESNGAMLVEWIAQVPQALPSDALTLRFDVEPGDVRVITARALGERSGKLLSRWLPG